MPGTGQTQAPNPSCVGLVAMSDPQHASLAAMPDPINLVLSFKKPHLQHKST
jgi:hypothetical protein